MTRGFFAMRLADPASTESNHGGLRPSGIEAGARATTIHLPEIVETGYPEIDNEHRMLVEECNRLTFMVDQDVDWADIVAAVQVFRDNLALHFQTEERFLQRTGFPRVATHTHRHRQILDRLAQIVRRISLGDGTSPEDRSLLRSLPRMLMDILLRLDLDYKSHLEHVAGR